ncbi:GAF domain-containing protein [Deinococcus sonorensis]|uniref:histidine kinase n=2 Tax=Deinococcus sonorensis TaxID=309891 RepID=A0AAU7UBB2_9DEIO
MSSSPEALRGASAALTGHLHHVLGDLASARTRGAVLKVMVAGSLAALDAAASVVLLPDEQTGGLAVAASSGSPDNLPGGSDADGLLAHTAFRCGQAQYVEGPASRPGRSAEQAAGPGAQAAVPMLLDGQALGVLVLDYHAPHTFTEPERLFLGTLAGQGAVALGRAVGLEQLDRLQGRTRQIEMAARAQDAFMAFSDAIGTETDLLALARQAIEVLRARFPDASIGYYEPENGRWKARVWSQDVTPQVAALIASGLTPETPMIARVLHTRQPEFREGWNAEQEQLATTGEYGAVANYPVVVEGVVWSMLSVGLRHSQRWTGADRALVRAVGRGLNLAIERAEAVQRLSQQNAELAAQTRALQVFADLTRDLALSTEPLLLVRRAQEVAMSMLPDGFALYYEPQGDLWRCRMQLGDLQSPELQATVDAGLPYAETQNLLTPWTTGQPYFQDVYHHDTDQLSMVVGHIGATATLPVRVGGRPAGVLALGLFHQRAWSKVDRVLLETVVRSLELALDRSAQARDLEEERAALEAFTRFTEAVGGETDVQMLVRQAITLLADTCDVDAAYFERDGDLFKARAWSEVDDETLVSLLQGGFPLVNSSIALLLKQNTAAFIDHWNDTGLLIRETGIYLAVAGYPYFVEGELQSVLMVGSRTSLSWDERARGIFRAVGRSLDLALLRARQTRMLQEQRDTLDIQTRELSAANEELEAFTYSTSHDLRTPVRHVMSFARLAQKDLATHQNDRVGRHLTIIEQAGERMTSMIDGMLVLSQAGRANLKPRRVPLQKLVTQAQNDVGLEYPDRPIHWQISRLPTVWGDATMLQQVMTNLISNGVKYSSTREISRISVWADEQPGEWVIHVQDNGVGFQPQYAQRLFGVFQRLHPERDFQGVGVGLAIVRRIILKHGGRVFAQGTVDVGATFSFSLPMPS